MPLLLLIPFHSGLFDITMIVMIIIIIGISISIFFVTSSTLCQIDGLLKGPISIEKQNRSKSILLLLLICY